MKKITRHYFDYAAATPLLPAVAASMAKAQQLTGNPSSLHAEGRAAREAVDQARIEVARVLAVKPQEIVFTSGPTESNNLAIFGSLTAIGFPKGEVLTLATEHPSVRQPLSAVKAHGYSVLDVPMQEDGRVDLSAFKKLLSPKTMLVSVAMATPEIGTVQPFREIAELIRHERARRIEQGSELPLLFHTDASSAAGLRPLAVDRFGFDLMSLGSAKVYGPHGVGALYVKAGTPLAPQLLGGGQELHLRAGTENIVGVVGFAKALQLAEAARHEEVIRLAEVRSCLWEALKDTAGITLNTTLKYSLPNTLNISFDTRDGEDLVLALDARGFAVATGAACAESSQAPSQVLLALGYSRERAQGSLRITLGRDSTASSVSSLAQAIRAILTA